MITKQQKVAGSVHRRFPWRILTSSAMALVVLSAFAVDVSRVMRIRSQLQVAADASAIAAASSGNMSREQMEAVARRLAGRHTAAGRPVYRLDAEAGEWAPVIPDELAGISGADIAPGPGVGGWVIEAKDGQPAYIWDPDTLAWKEAVPEMGEAKSTDASVPDVDCPLTRPSRLAAGFKGQVASPLNMRSSPGIANNWLMTMPRGTELEILGNPTCLPYGDGAYLWWQVEIPGSQTGWSAEAPQNQDFYFIDPIE